MFAPCPANRYRVEHTERLRRSFHALTGRNLIDPALAPEVAADALFHAPFVVLSHNTGPDPLLTYGNQSALELFELTWEELIQMPSRLTAEAPDQAERARLLAQVAARGVHRQLRGGARLADRKAIPDRAGDGLESDRRAGPILRPGRDVLRIPPQCGHGFHGKLDTHSISNWTGIPRETGHLR